MVLSLPTVSPRCRRGRACVTPEEDPTSIKKAKLESAKRGRLRTGLYSVENVLIVERAMAPIKQV